MAPNLQVHLLASIWMDLLVYGIYVPFFIAACYIFATKPSTQPISSRIFLFTNSILFIFSTSHMIVNLVRLIRAYGFVLGRGGTPLSYFQSVKINDVNYAHEVFMTLIPWFAGFLFMYRLYMVWDRRIWVLPLPGFLHVWSLATSAAVLRWIKHKFTSFPKIDKWIDSMYPLAFVEYLIITIMIVVALVRQSKLERAAGNPTSRGFALFMRIFWDSAALWAILYFIQIPLYFKNHPGQYVVQAMIMQSAGIIASIMAVRVHMSHSSQVLADATHQALGSDNESQQEKRAGQV